MAFPALTLRRDLADLAESSLVSRLRALPRLVGLVRGLASGPQALEQFSSRAYEVARDITIAEGAEVDWWGTLIGQARIGATDALYRGLIRARQLTRTSWGAAVTLRDIATLLLDLDERPTTYAYPVQVDVELPIASVDAPTRERLREQLTDAAPAEAFVGPIVIAPPTAFRLDDGPGLDAGELADSF